MLNNNALYLCKIKYWFDDVIKKNFAFKHRVSVTSCILTGIFNTFIHVDYYLGKEKMNKIIFLPWSGCDNGYY